MSRSCAACLLLMASLTAAATDTCTELRTEFTRRGCDASLSLSSGASPLVEKVFTEADGSVVRMRCAADNAICFHADDEELALTKKNEALHAAPNESTAVLPERGAAARPKKSAPSRELSESTAALSEGGATLRRLTTTTTAAPTHAPTFAPTVMPTPGPSASPAPTTTDITTYKQCVLRKLHPP